MLPTSVRVRPEEERPSLGVRTAGILSSLVLGLAAGVIGTFAHQSTWSLGSVVLPLGLIAGVLAVACLVAGLRIALDSRLHAALAALGVVVAVGVLALPGPSGSALLPANPTGFAWTIVPTLVCAVILAWPRTLGRSGGSLR